MVRAGSRPDGEAWIGIKSDCINGVDLNKRDARCIGCKLLLRESIDLCGMEASSGEERILVRGDEESISIGTEVRVVTQAWATCAHMIWRTLCAVILHRQAVNRPVAEGARGLAY